MQCKNYADIDSYFNKLKFAIDDIDKNSIQNFISILFNAIKSNKTIYIMGNGGSASTASHFCSDYNKGVCYYLNTKSKMICLNDNFASVMAYANDVGYDSIFQAQLKNFLQPDDIVIAISGSGNSENVVNAVSYANKLGAITISITGFDGGILKKLSKYNINVNVDDMQISENVHLSLFHFVSKALKIMDF